MIILDTNVISETMKSKPDRNVLSWLDLQNPNDLYLTSVTVAELELGVQVMPTGKRRNLLQSSITALIERDFHSRILSFDLPAARMFASHIAAARRAGHGVGMNDGLIAGIALAQGKCAVATRDRSPFEAMNVDVVDPWVTEPHT